ncbi:hypothetical protein [Streptomyces sp. NPDC055107]
MPLAFVFTGETKTQRASRIRRLEQAARSYFAGTQYAGGGITAVDYNQAVPVVVTELEWITADPDGAGKVWRRLGRDEDLWQTLGEALNKNDGDRLYAVQAEQAGYLALRRIPLVHQRPSRRAPARLHLGLRRAVPGGHTGPRTPEDR